MMLTEKPEITVITTVYKNRNTLKDCIDSVCAQDYPYIEYIIVDDGPNSVVDEKVMGYIRQSNKDIKIKIIHNDKNMGVSYSLNRAFLNSTGTYIYNLADDDCFYDNHVLTDWTNQFIKSETQILTAKRATYSQDLTNELSIDPSNMLIESIINDSPEKLFEKMEGYNYVFGCVTAKHRKLFEKYPYDSKYHIIEDYPIIMRMLRNGIKIEYYDRLVIKYRVGGSSYTPDINFKYLFEESIIFMKEIFPYSTNKIKAVAKYWKWITQLLFYKINKS